MEQRRKLRFKIIPHYPNYLVGNNGMVYSSRFNRFLKPSPNKAGYAMVFLCNWWGSKGFKVHNLVARAFKKNPKSLPEVNHEDGNKLNNWDWNLKWCTKKYNMQHARDTGLNTGNAKRLDPGDEKKIRYAHKHGLTYNELAIKYNVSVRTIAKVFERIKPIVKLSHGIKTD